MRILVFADAPSPNVQSFADGLREQGAEVVVVSRSPGGDIRLRLPGGLGGAGYVALVPRCRRLVRRLRPDLTIGYFVTGYGTIAALSGGRPLVQVVAGSDVLALSNRPLTRQVTATNLRRADLVLCWAEHLASAVTELGVAKEQILVCPRGVDLDTFKPAAQPVDSLHLISTRALQQKYRHHIVIEAVANASSHWTVTFLGEGPDRSRLRQVADDLGVGDRVTFRGHLDPVDTACELRSAAAYVSVIPTDGVSASLLEAMACGVRPIVFDNEANREWIGDPAVGSLVDGTVQGVADALDLSADPEVRERAFRRGRAVIEERGDRGQNMRKIFHAITLLVSDST